jgi:sec-independent protein translocase protein TatB
VFLFIFESIGTSELILIGIVALIFLGPRKLPEIAKTLGKYMSEFRNTTNEFKQTWEREVNFEQEEEALRTGTLPEKPVARMTSINGSSDEEIQVPEIREIDKTSFENLKTDATESAVESQPAADDLSDKRNWL